MSNSSFAGTQLNCFKYSKRLNISTTPHQSRPRGNGNEGILHIPQSSNTGASPSNSLVLRHTLVARVLPLSRDADRIFYSRADWTKNFLEIFEKFSEEVICHKRSNEK